MHLKLILFSFLALAPLFPLPKIASLLAQIDEQQQLKTDVTVKMRFIQERPVQGRRVFEMQYYRRDIDDAFLLLMLEPPVEKGNGYLKVGDHFWLYRRNTRTFQHIGRDENISGTDIKGGDLESRKMTELYQGEVDEEGKEKIEKTVLGNIPVYTFSIVARVKDVTYPRQTLYVKVSNKLILKTQNYTSSGTLMLTQYYTKYAKIKDRYIVKQAISIDEFEKGNRTMWQIIDVSLDKINGKFFTKGYLENLSR